MPFAMAQKAEKNWIADDTSAVWLEHEYLAEELMSLVASACIPFLEQAQLASAGASDGQ